MKIITIVGTRPEIIRLSRIIPKLDKLLGKDHILIHTGQNYDTNLSDIFFKELRLRHPDIYIGAKGSFGKQIAMILRETEKIFIKEKPDRVLVLGDTNSGLSAIIAERMGIPVYHMEAGNRCFDKRVPEEINRKIIDHASTYNFPYVPNSADNLYREGLDKKYIFICGNPIYEVMQYYKPYIGKSQILNKLKLSSLKYFLATFHRAEAVDIKERLIEIIVGLELVSKEYNLPIICSIHPRTRSKLEKWNIKSEHLRFLEPLGFLDFIKLERNAKAILSDSGTVCEEACILKTPHIIMRDSTERPETMEVGASILSGVNASNILTCTKIIVASDNDWDMPIDYTIANVSERMIKYLLSK